MPDTDHKSDHRQPWRGVLVLPKARSKSRLRAGLLASAAAAALFAATLHSIHAEAPQLKSATALVAAAQTPGQSSGFADLVAGVKPAVVSVRTKTEMTPQLMSDDDEGRPFEGTPFEKFFRDFGGKGMAQPKGNGHHEFVQGQGSGFFYQCRRLHRRPTTTWSTRP